MSLPKPTDRPSELFTWEIENFSKLETKLYSKTFYCGGYNWRVLIFPKGNKVEYLSAYLDVADSATLPSGWSRYACFSISVINQIDNGDTVSKNSQHKFNAEESDWGFTSLLPLMKLNNPKAGFLVNDTIVLETVTIPNSHDSKKETGDIASGTPSQSMINFVDASSEATANASKVRFLSYWVSLEAFLLLEKIHGLHNGTFAKFSMKGQAVQTVLLDSFASFIGSMSSTKVNEVNEESLQLAAILIEDFERVGLDLRWLKERLEEAKTVKKYSESVNTVDSCGGALEVARGALEVARAKVLELEVGLANAKAEVEVMSSRELPKSVRVNDFVLKDIV